MQVILSDGEHYCNGMLATQQNALVASGQIKENSLIRIMDFMSNTVQNRMVIIILSLDVVGHHGGRIGQPVEVDKSNVPAAPSAQPMYNRTNLPSVNDACSSNPYGGAAVNKPTGGSNPYASTSSAPFQPQAPIVRTTPSGVPITAISQLNMYQNRWTIKARVTSKSDIRTWSNARGEGSLFSVTLLDSSGVDIKATFFKEAVDKFFGLLEAEKVYSFSGGRLKVANQQYNTCKSQYEVSFDQNSEIHLMDDTGEIQAHIYDFSKIAALESVEAGKIVDILAVVKTVGEPTSIISKKTGQELVKCDMTIVDDSGTEIALTLWGDQARKAPSEFANQPIVGFRHVRVGDYGGKSLSTTSGGAAVVNPNVPEARALHTWWSQGGGNATRSLSSSGGSGGKVDSLEERKNIKAIKLEHLGMGGTDKADWISFKGTITFLKKDKEGGAWYTACARSEEPCKNRFKVTQTTDGNWFCDKCQGTFPNCVRRFIFSGTVADDTSTTWVSFFNEQAETLLGGVTADQVYKESFDAEAGGSQDKYDSYFARANHTEWIFKCRVKQEMVGEENRVKTTVHSMHPINYAKESRDLLAAISKF
jgi:replication factor A1